ncbi:MAG: AAA family ATPase [Alphaproteobacteria bacterium]|nr:AAA family ATPase [Alphaproteobacteria bacterium]
MKIKQVMFQNLNSLKGTWKIDFTNRDYVQNGIFAIIGRTGAGKTTILDAICLGLYGETSRIEVSGNNNEIMTKQECECRSEVCFEVGEKEYKSYFYQNKTKKGNLNTYIRTLSEKINDEYHNIAEKKEVSKKIEEITGLNFDRFQRSVLLAQGEFSKFLKSSNNEKSDILEQITGTYIYGEISKEVYSKTQKLQNELETKKLGIREVLTDEEINQKKEEIKSLDEELKNLNARLSSIDNGLKILEDIDKLEENLQKQEQAKLELKEQEENFALKKEILKKYEKAEPYKDLYNQYKILIDNINNQNIELKQKKKDLEEVEASKIQLEKDKIKADEDYDKFLDEANKAKNVFEEVDKLDGEIKLKQQSLNTSIEKFEERNKALINATNEFNDSNKEIAKLNNLISLDNQYIKEHDVDKDLEQDIEKIVSKNSELDNKKGTLDNLSKEYKKAEALLNEQENKAKEINEQKITISKKLNEIEEELKKIKENIEKLLKGLSLDELDERITDLKVYIELENKRKDLVEGKSCPLCGAVHHEFVYESKDISEKQNELNNLMDVKKLQKNEQVLISRQTELFKEKGALVEVDLSTCQSYKNNVQEQLSNCNRELENSKKEFGDLISKYGSNENVENLKRRKDAYQNKISNIKTNKAKLEQIERENFLKKEKKENAEKDLAEEKTNKDAKEKVLEELNVKRKEKFGKNNVDIERNRIELKKDELSRIKTEKGNLFVKAETEINGLNKRIRELDEKLNEQISKRKEDAVSLLNKIKENSFETIEELDLALCDTETIRNLRGENSAIEERRNRINAEEKVLRDQKENLLPKKPVDTKDVLKQQKEDVERERDENLSKKASLQVCLDNDNNTKAENEALVKDIADMEEKLIYWDRLNVLIGSANGEKFKKLVQGITFKRVISFANDQLRKITDRYMLEQGKENPLELFIKDKYQADEIRTINNLSGGETFIASLALALGLSKMSSQKIKIETLFLDEGFGSLSPDVLEEALETLSALHDDGKIIGIISHVDLVKEKILTQICVDAIGGGYSKMSGPGIEKV